MGDNYWKCLDCGNSGELTLSNAAFIDSCNRCGSKHLEVKMGIVKFILFECNKCHKVKDVKYLDTNPGFNEQVAKAEAKRFWKNQGILCTCSKSALWWILGIGAVIIIAAGLIYLWWKNGKGERERESKYLFNTKQSGEALELLTSLPANSTNLVFLDPQYEPVNNVTRLNYLFIFAIQLPV